jgi:hypothetical protein
MPQIDRINDLSRKMHAALLPAIGLGSLLALGAPGERAATA